MDHLFHDLPLHDAAPFFMYTYYASGDLIKYLEFNSCFFVLFLCLFVDFLCCHVFGVVVLVIL